MALSIKLSSDPINHENCLKFLKNQKGSGSFICQGSFANNSGKEKMAGMGFDDFEASAFKKLHKIADESIRRFRLSNALIHQQTGTIDPGKPILVMAFASDDPSNAYQACQFALQRLQSSFPVWKNERIEVNHIGARAQA